LVPDAGIEVAGGQTVATTSPAWLRIEPITALSRYKWIRLRYSASFFDEPVRPLIRFTTASGDTIVLAMNGPVLGSAEWVGRIPDDTVGAAISPVAQPGPFAFRLDNVTAIPRAALVVAGRKNPDWLYWAVRSRLLNSRREAWQALSFAVSDTMCGTPFRDYTQWRMRLARPLDLAGFDRPRSDWRRGPVFHLILKVTTGDPAKLRATIGSLRAQAYPRWSVIAVTCATADTALLTAFREAAAADSRLVEIAADARSSFAERCEAADFLALIDLGDTLPDHALAIVAETLAREPECVLLYGDEECVAPDCAYPILKPDWSPLRQEWLGYIGRATFVRAGLMKDNDIARRFLTDEESAIGDIAKAQPRSSIRHIRRILYRRAAPKARVEIKVRARSVAAEPGQWPDAAVIVPTRDGASLLAECFAGLRDNTDYPQFETIVVDNGSTAPDAVRLLQDIAHAPRTTVLRRPGPFNFSALCNDGAAATTARVLVFLNNDIAMPDAGWLKAMVRQAIRPETGVVGAKLLFPDGAIQHAGVVIGFGGIAGHIYRRAPRDYRGYLAELTAPHEVSAVTGACIAIERSKFDAVGGFDAENLPVDLNDIDLCLRVAEHGWTNLWTPEATLIHHQSGTRGIDSDPYRLYQKERSYFAARWQHVIRDDPHFHPALSLYAHEVALT
jgi:GT2 family glycosyltransferase